LNRRAVSGSQPERAAAPVLLYAVQHNVQTVAHCCRRSAAAGVEAGMTLAHARALLMDEHGLIEPADSQRDERALQSLAVWAMRYSPIVAPDLPDGLFIDITGAQRLFGGEPALLRRMTRDLNRAGFHAHVASASTFGCAWAMARFARATPVVVHAHGERAALADLPIEGLRLDDGAIAALHEIEIVRIGSLFDLPRHDLAARFGQGLLLRLDQALGTAVEAIQPVRSSPPPCAMREFDGPATQLEAIQITVRELLQTLCAEVRRMERGIRRLELKLLRINAAPEEAAIALSQPSRDHRHLWSLLGPKVERMNLGFGVEVVVLTATRTARLAHEQAMQWDAAASHTNSAKALGELIDTLAARLGGHRVQQAVLVESHVPERAFRWRSAADGLTRSHVSAGAAPVPRPSMLLPKPARVEVQALDGRPVALFWHGAPRRITVCIGPERIVLPWWKHNRGCLAARDYFKAQDERGRWLWLYRANGGDESGGGWYLHGVWA
jgi:protein ImuB